MPVFTARTGAPFTVSDSTNSLNAHVSGPYGIPRYTPPGPFSKFSTYSGVDLGANVFDLLDLPVANSFSNPALGGISDFGPYPLNMTTRNEFAGPGAWNFDLAVGKKFALTERFNL